jgi:hypothetical protein
VQKTKRCHCEVYKAQKEYLRRALNNQRLSLISLAKNQKRRRLKTPAQLLKPAIRS